MKKIYAFLTIAATIAFAENSFSQNTCESALVQPYVSSTQTGNQIFLGELGMQFIVNNAGGIIIKQLGAFDEGGNGITGTQSGGVRVAIFDRTTHIKVAGLDAIISGTGDAYSNNYRMKNITPVTLPVGDYVLVAKGFNSGEQAGNSSGAGGPFPPGSDGGGAITFGTHASFGTDDASPAIFDYPANEGEFGNLQQYLAGTFTFVTTSNCALSNIATLSGIGVPAATLQPLTPSFVQGTTSYTAAVYQETSSVDITPATTDAGATIKINGTTVASGSPLNQALVTGSNVFNIVVTAQNGTTTQTYTIDITRSLTLLPVVLTNFGVNLTPDNKVAISWTTQQETNSANFDVQKSSDGIHWASIALVKAAGTSSKPINYNAIDASPVYGANLYRIRSNDLDGKFAVSVVKNIRVTAIGKISLYPNPSSDVVNISLGSTPAADWNVSIINNSGQVIAQKKYSKNITTVSIPVNKLAAGNYTVQITDGDSKQINKIIISH